MHPHRRRKKRPNYGIRTVEVERGSNGFGFTISGQQPCILSCIVANSPADQAGLRAGDFLISVNGLSVSKSTHDAVVKLIGNSFGPIKMSIAEYYYSDSSDEELDAGRVVNNRKPKYMHKPRTQRSHKTEMDNAVENVEKMKDVPPKKTVKTQNNRPMLFEENNASGAGNSVNTVQLAQQEQNPIECKALVGYLGTIEMPKQLLPNTRFQTVASCIRKLRQEKRSPSAVLMTVLPSFLSLKNANNQILAIFPANRIVYISSSSDKESRYFGLVTSAISEHNFEQARYLWNNKNLEKTVEVEISNSCHIFVTDPKLIDHNTHIKKAENFKICCTPDIITGYCLEFPKNALYVVSLVKNMFRLQDSATNEQKSFPKNVEEQHLAPLIANSPQPSASSNSDSGIGFRDDCGNVSDRILVVEFPAQRQMPVMLASHNSNRPSAIDGSNLDSFDLTPEYSYGNINIRGKSNLFSNKKYFEHSSIHNSNNFDSFNVSVDNSYYVNNCRSKSNLIPKKHSELINKENHYEMLKNKNLNMHVKHRDKDEKLLETSVHKNDCFTRPIEIRKKSSSSIGLSRSMSPLSSDELYRNGDVDTGQIFSERPVDVPDKNPDQSYFDSRSNEDGTSFRGSVDNISMHSSKSFDLNTIKTVFKTPSTKLLEKKHTTAAKRVMKLSSCENLSPNTYDNDLLTYKTNHSCEELNNLDNSDKCGFGSLQDLCSWTVQDSNRRTVAVSEPDVRIHRDERNRLDAMRCEESVSNQNNTSGGPASWAGSFEKLLDDPLGVQIFAESLKKEFSAENIYFWTACERFRRLNGSSERGAEAQRIYRRHLCVGATEPVNVDSQGRQYTQQALQDAEPTLFEQAQKQIFNLMKFDSYPRFLKSDLYKQCLAGTVEYPALEIGLLLHPPNSTPSKLKKSLSNAEDRRRKSLLPWHRKNRSKSKDRGETEYNQRRDDNEPAVAPPTTKNGTNQHNVHSSQSSLTSLDLAMSCSVQDCASSKGSQDDMAPCNMNGKGALCRVILSDGATTVVQIRSTETVRQLANRLLDKRGLNYSAYEVHIASHPKAIDLNEMSLTLAGCEVVIEQRVVFKLDLPNRKAISVKSKTTKILLDVLRPILHKYGYSLDAVRVTLNGSNSDDNFDVTLPVTAVDGRRLNIQLCEDPKNVIPAPNCQKQKSSNPSLDEITNKVFEQLLNEKSESNNGVATYDRGSVKSEDWGSEHSSGIFGRFLRRDSAMHERKKKINVNRTKGSSNHSSVEDITGEQITKKPLIAKWKAGVKVQVACSESDELYEGLKRAQRSRLEDQRGTEINFELPDFLKDKENAQSNNKLRKIQQLPGHNETSRFYDNVIIETKQQSEKTISVIPPVAAPRTLKLDIKTSPEHTNTNNLRTPTSPIKMISEEKMNSCPTSPDNKSCSSLDSSASANETIKANELSPKTSEPPPLPPKPKVLPMKPSNWGQNNFFKMPRDATPKAVDRNKHTLFLEQSTSSFV